MSFMWCRGIRGATTVNENTGEAIIEATTELLQQMVAANDVRVEDVAFTMFTTTSDLNADFPAVAARQMGWGDSALLCGHEMNVPGALSMCIRILMMVNTDKSAGEIAHVYVRGAVNLRTSGAAHAGRQRD